jgi:(p)ppGpp synthase/HD superfamily hydrolase
MSSKPDDTQEGTLFSPLLEAAVRLAARGHYHQFRKHSGEDESSNPSGDFLPERIPYIAHLMGTMCILARVGVRDEVLAAAVLHDYLEDVPDPDGRESIRAALGDEVLSLVLEVTEHKRREFDEIDTWEIRKQEQLDHLEKMPQEAVLIKAADVLHNVLALLADLDAAEDPENVWQPFNAGPDRQLWYFSGVSDAVRQRLGVHPLAQDLQRAVDRLKPFVSDEPT